MSNEPLPMAVRLLIFVAMEGAIAWHLVLGLRKGRFAFLDTPERIEKKSDAVRYWGWVGMLIIGMGAVGWLAWGSFGWGLVIVAACAHDRSYCP